MIVYVSAENGGNVFIREGPSRFSPSIKIPAYNFNKYGVLYDCDEIRNNTGVTWYHLRGLGWAMGEYFSYYAGDIPNDTDTVRDWLIGLNAEQIQSCIDYLQAALDQDGMPGVD